MRLWFDTDIGDDIDDILAISWAIKNGVEIMGISTVYRDANERRAIVCDLLNSFGKSDIPVYEGYSTPLTPDPIKLGKLNYKSDNVVAKQDPAKCVDAIIEAAGKYDDLVFLIIGAQTNIARACLKAPDVMKKAKFVIMGGAFYLHTAEWNIVCDPVAAEIVSKSGADMIYVPWDVTRSICIGQENYDKILAIHEESARGLLAGFVRQWAKRNSYIPLLHDPAAFYYCINPSIFSVVDIPVKVVCDDSFMGLTLNLNYFTLRKRDGIQYPVVKVVEKADNSAIVDKFMKDVFDV